MAQVSRNARGDAVARLLLALLLTVVAAAWAETVTIRTGNDPDARLEIRTVVLPGGTEQELYVVTAERVEIETEDQVVTASRIEFDPDAGVVRIVGEGQVVREGETLRGRDLVVELDTGRLDGDDMVVITDAIEVRGERASRAEGRIQVLAGAFSPCARCDQEVEDYGFRAERIEILPGDRLIAWNATFLIRASPVFDLPLLVLPLAEPARTPRVSLKSGDASSQAELRVDWPYVAGPNAFGTVTYRVLADVDPSAGGALDGGLLGGAVQRAYLAASIDHRFYDERGAGRLQASFDPPLVERENREAQEERIRFEARYQTDPQAGTPEIDLRLARDDAARDRLVEGELELGAEGAGVRTELESRVSFPLREDAATRPSWDGRSTPRSTFLRARFRPLDLEWLRAGSLRVRGLELDVGVFEDQPDPTNRSAASAALVTAGRVREAHDVELTATSVAGVEVSGRSNFVGHYYDTGERLIDWDTRLEAVRRFGDAGRVTFTARRDANEGETPFSFDRISLRTRTELEARLDLTPFDGLRLDARGGYVVEDDRRPDALGFGPVEATLTAFTNLRPLDARLAYEGDPRVPDAGTLEAELGARLPSDRWQLSANVSGLADLDADVPEDAGGDQSRVDGSLAMGLRDRLVLQASSGYVWNPDEDDAGPFEPLDLSLTAGTLQEGDGLPGLEATWSLDLDSGETRSAGYRFTTDLGPLRAELDQQFGRAGGPPGDHLARLAWPGVAALEVEGVELLPGATLGLAADPGAARDVAFRVVDATESEDLGFRAELRLRRSPGEDGGLVSRDTTFEARARLAERRLADGAVRLALDGFVDVAVADAALDVSYLRRANLELGLDLGRRVGLQGTFGYRGRVSGTDAELVSGRLSFEEASLVVRATNELVVGATLDDTWELVADAPGNDAIDPRPTLFATWDRCCWALYGSWNTRSGEVILTLGAPGQAEGPQLAWEDGPVVPAPFGEGP
ncbi:MAG: hypothetical protein U5K81_12245 [Trueperaceae bacterium]|nr:hypothetical protein [Trueperaceae bacterium]